MRLRPSNLAQFVYVCVVCVLFIFNLSRWFLRSQLDGHCFFSRRICATTQRNNIYVTAFLCGACLAENPLENGGAHRMYGTLFCLLKSSGVARMAAGPLPSSCFMLQRPYAFDHFISAFPCSYCSTF